jgi:2-polyprenyl-6-hydroxyphenyl methylase/3-demethylubiquinone-9 3-methyltransferase
LIQARASARNGGAATGGNMVEAPRDTRTTVDPEEIARFAALADDWWNPRGRMRPLHRFNPARIAFIRDRLCAHYGRDPKALDCLARLSLLDVGCGGGVLAEPLARLGAAVTGIDPAPENVEAARHHAGQSGLTIDYRVATIEQLAEARERFDAVIASEVVEHVADLDLFVGCSAACVKPGGLFVVTTINRTLKSFALVIVGAEYVLRWLPIGTHRWEKFVAPAELEATVHAAGLDAVDKAGIVYNPFADEWRLSRDTDVNYAFLARKNIVLADTRH